jgi:hypothetical protein
LLFPFGLMGEMLDSQRSKFWSTLLLLILSFGLRLAGFASTGTGQGALGARIVFKAEPLAVVRVALVDTLALVWQSKAQVDRQEKANSYSLLDLQYTLLTT